MGNYRVILKGSSFVIKHNAGAAIDVCMTEKEAKQKMELCQQDDLMLDTAKVLIEKAVAAHMLMHNIDRETAHEWIRESMR